MTLAATLFAVAAVSCGGGGGGSPSGPPMAVVTTVSGSTTSNGAGSCSADSHDFQVAQGGTIRVRLDASGDAAGLRAQVCADGIDNNNCTVALQLVEIGNTVSGIRQGSQTQNLKFLRLGCTGGGPLVIGPTTYSATVTYDRP